MIDYDFLLAKCCKPGHTFNLNWSTGVFRASVHDLKGGVVCGPDEKDAALAIKGLVEILEEKA